MRNLVFIVCSLVTLASCGVSRELKKDNKAATRVYERVTLQDRLYPFFLSLHPINQKPVYSPGKDTTIYRTDTLVFDRVHDSLIKVNCPMLNLDSLRKANTKNIYYRVVDTLTVPDSSCSRRLDLALSVQYNLEGQLKKETESKAEYKQTSNERLWWLIGVSVLSFLVIGFLVYLLIKKK